MSTKRKMNFIIFVADELRNESLYFADQAVDETNKHIKNNTPNITEFAKGGTRFQQCHTVNTTCSQSRASFMTGWYTHVMGHRTLYNLLKPEEPNLLKYLKNDGYDIMWWGKNDMFAEETFFKSVTSVIDYNTDPKNMAVGPPYDNLKHPMEMIESWFSLLYQPWTGKIEDSGEYLNVKAAMDYLQDSSKGDNPFVLYLPLLHPHPPYSCPEDFYNRIKAEEVPDLRGYDMDGQPDYRHLIRKYRHLEHQPEILFKKNNAVYLGSTAYIDYLFGMLMDALNDSQHKDNTTVLFYSDHGDYAGDYGLVEKWPSGLEDVLTHVPLIIQTPGGKQNTVVEHQVQSMDIVPTILNLADVEVRHTHFARDLTPFIKDGAKSNAEKLLNNSIKAIDLDNQITVDKLKALENMIDVIPASFRGDVIFAEGGYGTNEPFQVEQVSNKKTNPFYPKYIQQKEHRLSVCRATMVRTPNYKLILRSDPLSPEHFGEFYCLDDDPREINNRYSESEFQSTITRLKELLLRWYIETSDAIPWELDSRESPVYSQTQQPDSYRGYVPFR